MTDNVSLGPRLPIEVIERVIDWINDVPYDKVDYRTIRYREWKACALTCHAMRPRSQYWLFRRILLRSKRQAETLKPILQNNKAIAGKVRTLELMRLHEAKDYTWISWVPLVFAPLMINLHGLELHYDVFANAHPQFFTAITAFKSIQRLDLTFATLSRLGQCTALTRAFPNLCHLEIGKMSWKPDPAHLRLLHGTNRRSRTRRRVQITHLDIWDDCSEAHQMCQWLSDTETVKDLRTFYGWDSEFRILMGHRMSGGYHLRSLFLKVSRDDPIPIANNSLHSLQGLHLDVMFSVFPFDLLTSILLSTPRALRKVVIYVEDPEEYPTDHRTPQEVAVACAELDNVLCNPNLQDLELSVCLYRHGASIRVRDRWQRWLGIELPKFCEHEGRLEVTWGASLKHPGLRWMDHRDNGFYDEIE